MLNIMSQNFSSVKSFKKSLLLCNMVKYVFNLVCTCVYHNKCDFVVFSLLAILYLSSTVSKLSLALH